MEPPHKTYLRSRCAKPRHFRSNGVSTCSTRLTFRRYRIQQQAGSQSIKQGRDNSREAPDASDAAIVHNASGSFPGTRTLHATQAILPKLMLVRIFRSRSGAPRATNPRFETLRIRTTQPGGTLLNSEAEDPTRKATA